MIDSLIKECLKKDIKIEVYKTDENSFILETFNKSIKNYNISKNTNYKLKALYKNKNVYLYTNNIENPKYIIDKILYNYELSDNYDLSDFSKNLSIKENKKKKNYIDYKEVSDSLKSLNNLKKEYKDLKIINCYFYYVDKDILIENEKVLLKDNINYIELTIEVVVCKNNIKETNYRHIYINKYNEKEILKEVQECIKEAIEKTESVSPKTGKQKVIIKNSCVYEILNAFNDMFFSKSIRLNLSVLKDKFDKKVFSDKLTIVEDPCNIKHISSRLFDDEGVKTYYKEIVKNGVFKTKLYDNEEAKLCNAKSTANSYGVRNMYIIQGEQTFDELLKEMNEGIVITQLAGLHSGRNNITGDFSIQCEGYSVKKGKETKRLKMFIMSSNILELFKNIENIGNDLKFIDIYGGSPSILFKNIDIAGSEE